MKTIYLNYRFHILKISIFLLFLCYNNTVFAQVPAAVKDTTGYNTGVVEIKNPPSILDAYTYDVATNRYIYTSTFDGFNINYPIILTPKEYE